MGIYLGDYPRKNLGPADTATAAYIKYINEHCNNVKLSFEKYGEDLCDWLNIDIEKLRFVVSVHDESKFSMLEFDNYRQYFFPKEGEVKDKDLFEIGWLHHKNTNKHHPEYWCNIEDGNIKYLDMPNIYIAEMLLDWAAMGLKFKDTAYSYYQKNRNNKPLSDNTRKRIDLVIHLFK